MKLLWKTLGATAITLAMVGCGNQENGEAVESTESPLMAGSIGNGEYLFTGQTIWSTNCSYRVVMQGDGNLVVYNSVGTPMWNAGTVGHGGAWAVLQGDGNFVIYPRDGGRALWSTNTTSGQRLSMQGDSNLVLYSFTVSSQGVAIWSSGTVHGGGSCTTPRRTEVMFVQGNVDRPGLNLPNTPFSSPSAGACANSCAARSDCLSYSFTGGTTSNCWLKSGVAAPVTHTGITSGVKRSLCNGASSC